MYAVKEIFYTLQGEGANAGSRRRVLPLCRLQSVVRPRAGSRHRRLPVLRHRFRRHRRRRAAASSRPPRISPRRVRRRLDRRRRRPPRRADRRRADAAGRCRADRCAACTRLHASPSRPTARCPLPRGIDWICVSPKAGTDLVQTHGRRIEARLSAGGPRCRTALTAYAFAHRFLQPMDGPDQDRNTDRPPSPTARAHPAGACRCRPTS